MVSRSASTYILPGDCIYCVTQEECKYIFLHLKGQRNNIPSQSSATSIISNTYFQCFLIMSQQYCKYCKQKWRPIMACLMICQLSSSNLTNLKSSYLCPCLCDYSNTETMLLKRFQNVMTTADAVLSLCAWIQFLR